MHTPGPWTAERQPHGYHIGPQPDGVCTIHDNSDGSKRDEQAANARLIAAAPILLAACQAAQDGKGDWRALIDDAIAHATQEPTP